MDETTDEIAPRAPRRRLRGLRPAALPRPLDAVQWLGGAFALLGVYLQWGGAATLMIGGVAAVVIAVLVEGGKL